MKILNYVGRWLPLFLLWPSLLWAELNIQHWQTNNGSRVYFVETHDLPMVDIRVVFDAGSAREGKKYGLASMTNVLMPAGSKNYTEDQLAATFEDNGAEFSNVSLRDMSVFTLRSLSDSELLTPVTDALSDILLNPAFPQEAFDRDLKRALVGLKAEEQNQGTVTSKVFMQTLYNEHPYAHSPSGTLETMQSLTREDLAIFHSKLFSGKNSIVVIVGDLDLVAAKNLANKLVGRLPEGETPKDLPEAKLVSTAIKVETEFPSSQSHILIGQPGIKRNDPDYFPLYVGNHVLGGSGLVSRISKEIRENRGLAYSAYSYFNPMREAGPFLIGMQTKNENKSEGLEVIKTLIRDFIKNGPTKEELQHAKSNIIGGFPLRLDSNKKQAEYVAMIGFYNLPLDYLNTFSAKVKEVSLEEIQDAWQRRILPEKFVTVTVGKQAL